MRSEIHLFGGQGSSALFHPWSLCVVKSDANTARVAEELLSACHASFIQDCLSIQSHDDELSRLLIQSFPTSASLLSPPETIQSNPIVRGTTLFLYQLLRFIGQHQVRDEDIHKAALAKIQEIVGFCSGILPAVVLSASPTLSVLVQNAVQAFRAAFWIGYRAQNFSRKFCASSAVEGFEDEIQTYAVMGMSSEDIVSRVRSFNEENSLPVPLSLTGFLRQHHVTISGTSKALDQFRAKLPTACSTRKVHVGELYHGGEIMTPALNAIVQDLKTANIVLPSTQDLRLNVRFCSTGLTLSSSSHDAPGCLTKRILEEILIHVIDWPQTLDNMARSLENAYEQDISAGSNIHVKVLAYGPFSNLMLSDIHGISEKLSFESADVAHENTEVQIATNYFHNETDIAIVGVGLDFPNGSTIDEFWASLLEEKSFVQEAPEGRFDITPGGEVPSHGNFVRKPFAFDNSLFNISPREAMSMDPQQRLLLQCAYHALEHSGYVPDSTESTQKETFGCFVGVATGDYADRISDDIDVYYSPGTLRAFLSGRISYYFGHSGPSVVIDTACSGSLVAIYQACQALNAKQCNAALAGGVNVICGKDMQSGLARAHFLSPTGQCQPFEAEADGYSRAEGCAMFVLKRLRDAVADNDRILGVIKGSGINQSGNAKSITHPHADTQKRLFEQVFKCSQVIPQTINVVEAHGTGTQAGDPIEFESISKGLASGRSTSNPLYITSVKGNIGHAEAASGSAGLIKLLKMMESETIPPQASLDTLNPKIQALKTDKVIIPMEKTSWVTPQARPRRALLNNFGAAGSNACLILEEWVSSSHASSTAPLRDSYVFALSAKDKPAFTRSRNALIESLKGNTSRHSIQHLSYTSLRRPLMDVRLLVTANSSHQLLKILQDPATQPVEQTQQLHKTNRIAFVFSGQGSQYIGMAKYLFDTVPAFSNDIHSCNKILLSLGRPSILPVLEGAISIEKTTLSAMHCAVFAIQYGLSRLWTSWGVRPTATFGHSLGEYAAMVTAEVISVADALAILSYRAELIEELCEVGKSCMIAVKASAAEVDEILQSRQLKLEEASLACDNSPGDCVITTSIAVLDKVMSTFADHGVKTRKLDMPFGYHSSRMEVLRGRLDKFTSRIWLRKPAIPLGLGLDGRILGKDDELDHRYFSSQAISPVRFRELVQNYESRSKQQNDIFLEIGPHPVLLPAIRASKLSSTPAAFIQSLNKKKGDWPSLIESSAELARQGVQLQWRKHFQEEDSTLVEMPLYQFADTEFMPPIKPRRIAEAVNPGVKMASNPEISPFLSAQKLNSTTGEMLYTASDKILPFVDGHRVTDIALCPASVYLELALQGARHCQKLDNSYSVRNIVFSAPILRQGQDPLRPIEVAIEGCHGFCDSIGFKINYSNATQTSTVSCCHGYLLPRKNDGTETSLISERIQRTMEKHRMGRNSEHPTIIRRKMLYESIFTRVVSYSSTYQTIDWLQMSDNGQEGWGSFRLRPGAMFNGCVSQPVFVDTLLHAAGFIANCYVKSSEVCICTHVERFDMIGGANIDYGEPFTLYSQIDYTDTKVIGDSYAFTPDGTLVAFIRGVEFKRLSRETFSRSLNLALKSSSQKGSVETTSKQQVTTDIPIREKPKRAKTTESIPKAKSIHLSLLDIIQDVTGISDVNAIESGTFANVGIDSLMMTELCERLRREFPSLSETGESEMAHCETLTELEAILENAIRADDTPSTTDESQPSSSGRESPITDESVTDEDLGASTHNLKSQTDEKRSSATSLKKPVLLQKGSSSAAPLYLIHDGSGMCSMYSRISRLNRDVFGIAAGDNAAPQSVSDMAQKYLTLIDTCEPIILAGWSFGGVVAYEMARILRSRNQAVAGLVIIDSPCPTDHKGLPDAALQNICIGKPAWLLRNFQIHAAALGAFQPNISQGSLDVPVILLQSKDLVEIESSCGGYAPFLDDASERNRNVQLWKQLLKQNASVLKIPGHHFQAFDENVVGETSVSLAMAIREIEQAQ